MCSEATQFGARTRSNRLRRNCAERICPSISSFLLLFFGRSFCQLDPENFVCDALPVFLNGETLELARKMIGKPRLAFLLAKQAIGAEDDTALDAEAVAQILGVHKRHAYRLIKSATCQMKKRITVESQKNHKRFAGESQHVATGKAPKKHV